MEFKRIGLRGGHSLNCQGATGIVNEYLQMQQLYKYVRDILVSTGHTVINCNSNASNEGAELTEGTTKANNNNVDLYLTLHMNSYNGSAHGVEAWVYSTNSKSYAVAKKLTQNYANLGFYNRGVKTSTNLHDLRKSVAPAIILETCFCDSRKDIEIWKSTSWQQLAKQICNAI